MRSYIPAHPLFRLSQQRLGPLLLASLLVWVLGSSSHADDDSAILHKPSKGVATAASIDEFSATYKIRVNNVPTGIQADFFLRRLSDNDYHFHIDIDSLLFDYSEHSYFNWSDCRSRPSKYQYKFHGLGTKRNTEIEFDHQTRSASGRFNEEERQFPISPTTTDGLSYSMMVLCDIDKGLQEMQYHLAYGHKVYRANIVIVGEEMIKTPAGKFLTKVVERRYSDKRMLTRFWLAPELDYFMVKFEHRESHIATGTLLLKELTREPSKLTAEETSAADKNGSS